MFGGMPASDTASGIDVGLYFTSVFDTYQFGPSYYTLNSPGGACSTSLSSSSSFSYSGSTNQMSTS